MIILVCRTNFAGDATLPEWEERRIRMRAIVSAMPGYITHQSYYAPDGDYATIYKFDSEEALDAWHIHPEHQETQQRAREDFYQSLYIVATRVIEDYRFMPQKPQSPLFVLLWKRESEEDGGSLEYKQTVETMRAIVSDMPGHISCKTYVDPGTLKTLLESEPLVDIPDVRIRGDLKDSYSGGDRESVTVIRLESEEALKAWSNRSEYWGTESLFQSHEMQVCHVFREYSFAREDVSEPSPVPWWYTPSGTTSLVTAAHHKIEYKVRRY